MQQIMTIKELMAFFGMEVNRKNSLKLLKVLKKLQSDEKLEILRKIGKCYFVVTSNVKTAFPALFESMESNEENSVVIKGPKASALKRELLDESERKMQSAIHQYSTILRQLEKKNIELTKTIAKLDARITLLERKN